MRWSSGENLQIELQSEDCLVWSWCRKIYIYLVLFSSAYTLIKCKTPYSGPYLGTGVNVVPEEMFYENGLSYTLYFAHFVRNVTINVSLYNCTKWALNNCFFFSKNWTFSRKKYLKVNVSILLNGQCQIIFSEN